jgi:hypothetical protein
MIRELKIENEKLKKMLIAVASSDGKVTLESLGLGDLSEI